MSTGRMQIDIRGERMNFWVRGEILAADRLAVAVVGARRASEKGMHVTNEFVCKLASSGVTIVSGGARGIDSVAHQAAIDAGGRTIAVLGCGIDVVYPPENQGLFEMITEHGALLSPFPPGTKPLKENFKPRNRIVAGLSRAVLVVEAQRQSGTLNTVNHAAEMNIEVFAVPGSPGTDWLIEQGVTRAENPRQLLTYILQLDL